MSGAVDGVIVLTINEKRLRMIKYLILFFVFLFIRGSNLFATYSLESYSFLNTTLYTVDTASQADNGNRSLVLLEYVYLWAQLDGQVTDTLVPDNASLAAAVTGTPSVYPNPFRFSDNPQFGYFLSKDLPIEIRIYDMKAHEVFRGNYTQGTPGGGAGYNRIYITRDNFHGRDLASGVYFFLIINEGKVLAKGKFVVKP